MPSKNQLPQKENALFKRVAKCYEQKQYKNGLKFAKQILSNPKFALHGETLAMKGLILNSMGRKQEAYEFVRKGLRNDLTSHVCWHAFGILQRSDKKYDESIKCYRNALKYEKDNTQILRDLSLVQIQTRDLEGYRETKYQLFKSRPGIRLSWIEFALACHLLQDYDFALKIIDEFIEKNHTSNTDELDYENSELLLYKTMIMKEAGQISEALEHLKKSEKKIFDKITLMETTAELLILKGNFDEAKNVYIELLNRNSENTIYFEKYLEANQLTEPELIVDSLEMLQVDFPKSVPLKLLILKYATENKFENVLSSYLKANLRKGVPPLFKQLKSLYQNKEKVQVIEQMLLTFSETLLKHRKFNEDDNEGEEIEHATTLLWTYFYLAQHFDHLSNTKKALHFVSLAMKHTPTLIELMMLEGRIHKHAGNIEQAVKCLDEAQSLDTADRYLNSKCAKYMLKANNVQQAEDLCSKFTREGVTAMECLNEMQCMWFQIECALAYQRQKKYGDALKKCHEIDRHFSEIIEDQFDFHTYCMRKVTLRSYVNFLRLEDILRSHPFYFKAAKCAIEVYLMIYDHPEIKNSTKANQSTENLEPSELKKLLNKQRKAKKKAEQKNEEAAQALVKKEHYNRSKQQQDVENDAPQLDELLPEKLLQIDDPLEQAIKFLKPLLNLLPNMIETHLFAFEIYYRQKKIMLMLQAIKKAFEIEKTNGKLHSCIIRFYCFVRDNVESKTEILQKIIHEETDPIFQKLTAVEINKNYLLNFGFNFGKRIEAAKMYYFLNPDHQKQALELLLTFKNDCTHFDLKDCELGYTYLRNGDFGECDEETKKFMEICKEVYPYATIFSSNELHSSEMSNSNEFHSSPNVKTETCDKY